jgi:hypothetical protein
VQVTVDYLSLFEKMMKFSGVVAGFVN